VTPFSQVQSVTFGCKKLLWDMHRDLMQQMRTAESPGEREAAAEKAGRIRDWMNQMDMCRLIVGASRW
jgi:hypothetical protein